jgi:cell division protein FtsL
MISRSVLFGMLMTTCVAVALFQLKHKVNEQERELARIHSKIYSTEESIHILQAEWSYLNEPGRLQALAEKHLKLMPSDTIQLVAYENIGDITSPHRGGGFSDVRPVKY